LALVEDPVCVIRYDNEAGKGDHRHIGRVEKLYKFVDPETLLAEQTGILQKTEDGLIVFRLMPSESISCCMLPKSSSKLS